MKARVWTLLRTQFFKWLLLRCKAVGKPTHPGSHYNANDLINEYLSLLKRPTSAEMDWLLLAFQCDLDFVVSFDICHKLVLSETFCDLSVPFGQKKQGCRATFQLTTTLNNVEQLLLSQLPICSLNYFYCNLPILATYPQMSSGGHCWDIGLHFKPTAFLCPGNEKASVS